MASQRLAFAFVVRLPLACATSRAPVPAQPVAARAAPAAEAQPAQPPAPDPIDGRARVFVAELAAGRWDHPETPFDGAMTQAVTAAQVRTLWESLEGAGGRFSRVIGVKLEKREAYRIANVSCAFERLHKVIRVVFDAEDRVTGLFFGPVPEEIEAKTRFLIAALARADFVGATRDFGPMMKGGLPPPRLAAAWAATQVQVGPWRSVETIELRPEGRSWLSLATLRFERDRMAVKVAYDVRDEIVGLFFAPVEVPWTPPAYAKPEAFEERSVVVGTAPALPGTLTLPKGPGPFAAVVLVHGSGPNDRDESEGGVKVFKDLAWGLASQGIAVLRYEKRSRHSPAGIVTQKEEVVDGARDALALLRQTPEVDARRVFLLGHSQGGSLAPRIATGEPDLAGVIILAGATRSMGQLLIDQYTYLSALAPENATLREGLEAARRFKRTVEDPALRPDQEVEHPSGARLTGAYVLDDRAYDPGATARKLGCRLLLLQGLRDYQVTMVDFEGWRGALGASKRATFKTYPALNHLFVAGTGKPSPAEYERPGHVDAPVVDDIARWIGDRPQGDGRRGADASARAR